MLRQTGTTGVVLDKLKRSAVSEPPIKETKARDMKVFLFFFLHHRTRLLMRESAIEHDNFQAGCGTIIHRRSWRLRDEN